MNTAEVANDWSIQIGVGIKYSHSTLGTKLKITWKVSLQRSLPFPFPLPPLFLRKGRAEFPFSATFEVVRQTKIKLLLVLRV